MTATRAGLTMVAGLVVVATAGGPVAARAQATNDDNEATGKVGCLQGHPLPACKSFWIVEVQGYTPLVQTERALSYGDAYPLRQRAFESGLEWNLGHMVNVGDSWAVGGALSVGTGNADPLTGIKVRVRRWLSADVSLEMDAGMLRTDANGSRGEATAGGTVDLRVNIKDYGAFFLRWDGVPLSEQNHPVAYHDPGGFQQAFSVGAGLGSKPALVGTGAGGVVLAVLLALLIPHLD
jgi:hypothetical protein